MIAIRCRQFGQPEWTEIYLNGIAEQRVFSAAISGLTTGHFEVQLLEDGEWTDVAELEFDDGKEVE